MKVSHAMNGLLTIQARNAADYAQAVQVAEAMALMYVGQDIVADMHDADALTVSVCAVDYFKAKDLRRMYSDCKAEVLARPTLREQVAINDAIEQALATPERVNAPAEPRDVVQYRADAFDADYQPAERIAATLRRDRAAPAFEQAPAADVEYTLAPVQAREAWLNEAGDYIARDLIEAPAAAMGLGFPPVRYSVGFAPNTRAGSKILGFCCKRAASADHVNEIFVTPAESDSMTVLATLTHELIHAFLDNEDGHKGRFASLARTVGLTGKMTATTAGPELQSRLADYIEELGHIPHAVLDVSAAKKKQASRMLKVGCTCGFSFRISRTQFEAVQCFDCNACGLGDGLKLDL